MKYYFIADDFNMEDMSFGTLLQVSTNPELLSKDENIWVFESDNELFDFDSLEEKDSRVKPYNGCFEYYYNFEEEDEFDNVRWNWDKLADENVEITYVYTIEYQNGKCISSEIDLESIRKTLRKCIKQENLIDELIETFKGKISNEKLEAIKTIIRS